MAVDEKSPSPERTQTDESLRVERDNTDRAIAERHAIVEHEADKVIQHARENADAVLKAAREKADARLEGAGPAVGPRAALAQERGVEDEVLRVERAVEDASLHRERTEDARALAELLPLERERTDRHLLTERARSDDAVTNRDDFLGIVSHDLRNLLGGVVMSAASIAKRAADERDTLADTQRIQRYAARMNRLVGDLVDVASIDAGKLALHPVRGDATAVIAEAVEMFQASAAAHGLSLERDRGAPPLLLDFDHDRLLQVLANLITNAVKFSAPGGRITVRGERSGTEFRGSVEDTGSGIPPHLLGAVFERYWQVDKSDRRGVGLGLYISRCIIEAHGGRIWVESKLGEGTKVCFSLPLR